MTLVRMWIDYSDLDYQENDWCIPLNMRHSRDRSNLNLTYISAGLIAIF